MVSELLKTGADNAISGRELADILGCNLRKITLAIKAERQSGTPICAMAKGKRTGYYLPETPDELENYCNRLYHRGGELFKTRRALLKQLEHIKCEAEQDGVMV